MIKNLNKRVKKLDLLDIVLIKVSVIIFVLIILKLIPNSVFWLDKVNVIWFFVLLILFSWRPLLKYWE